MITEKKEFLKPKKVFIPITDEKHKMATTKVAEGDQVKIGQLIAVKYKGKEKVNIVSPISGSFEGLTQKLDRYNNITDHIIIKNDFENTYEPYDKLQGDLSSAVIRNRLADFGIKEVSVDGLFTDIDFSYKINHIVVNAIFINEPFISIDYDFIKDNAAEIVDGIHLLKEAAYAKTMTIIVDKFMDQEALDALGEELSDTDIELRVINRKKVDGADYRVIKDLTQEKLQPNLLENGVIYTTTHAVKMVYDAVRLAKPITKRLIAITGDGLKKNLLAEVTIGMPLLVVTAMLGGYEKGDLNLHIGSFLTGHQVENDSLSIKENINSINISSFTPQDEEVCIKCGDCNDICPAGILPQNIMDAELRNVNERIFELHTDECVECGLCSYVCPSKINVLEWVRRAKRRTN
ncbi:MAG: 4Fe-4S dicluster domain-containing protein [Candidatus Izimaplasma sp.]|nr:4Fe-4S dicluster domain-containing protein [Candidatus Izimaplasma bacterium]